MAAPPISRQSFHSRDRTAADIANLLELAKIGSCLLLIGGAINAVADLDWPIHVVRMPWVNPDLFFEAFSAAIEAHAKQHRGRVDIELLKESVVESLRDMSCRVGRGDDINPALTCSATAHAVCAERL
jgi:hypothetical protein